MRESSNPIFGALLQRKGAKTRSGAGNPQFSSGNYNSIGNDNMWGYSHDNYGQQTYGQQTYGQQAYGQQAYAPSQGRSTTIDRPMTIDDVVTKTGITLFVIILTATITFGLIGTGIISALPPLLVGSIGGFIMVCISTWGRKMDSPVVTLLYALFEGALVGSATFVFTSITIVKVSAGALIFEAIAGTLGVFIGMLVVYKTGAIRVTPKFTRILIASMFGILILALVNIVASLFGMNMGLRSGAIGIFFSLFCIVIAALSFLLDFDQADKLIRAGVPSQFAWGVALGLAVTLVWLYLEILRLLVILSSDRN